MLSKSMIQSFKLTFFPWHKSLTWTGLNIKYYILTLTLILLYIINYFKHALSTKSSKNAFLRPQLNNRLHLGLT